MPHGTSPIRFIAILALVALQQCGVVYSQNVDVRAHFEIARPATGKSPVRASSPDVVLWLNPVLPGVAATGVAVTPGHFSMVQKDKAFHPHLLVVPLGSIVAFPNLDPFFHDVFSQFNGRRFDLGLYESGSSKEVRFDREGVSYIFCDIHPEMSAVIVTLSTPWYVVARGSGTVVLRGVPEGAYEMHLWAEGVDTKQLEALTRRVRISSAQNDLGVLQLTTSGTAPAHKNKFGDDYPPGPATTY